MGFNQAMRHRRRRHIHAAWIPAAVFFTVTGVVRWGWPRTLTVVAAGLALAAYAEWSARRRRRRQP
jgi:hypothetical protein